MWGGNQSIDFFDTMPLALKQCTTVFDFLALDTDYITDDFDEGFGEFVRSIRIYAKYNLL